MTYLRLLRPHSFILSNSRYLEIEPDADDKEEIMALIKDLQAK